MNRLILLGLFSVSTLLASDIRIENPYVRATPPNLPNSAAFMSIKNDSNKDISIVSGSSKIAKAVELHTHDMKNGVMKMYQVPKINIAANSKTTLKPGGLHVMFIGLKKPLKIGEDVTFTLNLSNGETKTITAPVKKVMSGMKHHKNMHHNHSH